MTVLGGGKEITQMALKDKVKISDFKLFATLDSE